MTGDRVASLVGYGCIGIATVFLADGWAGIAAGFFLALAISLIVSGTPRR